MRHYIREEGVKSGPYLPVAAEAARHNAKLKGDKPTARLGGPPEPVPGARTRRGIDAMFVSGKPWGHLAVALCFWGESTRPLGAQTPN
jgi:hypothetical protein